jgi:RNA-directed DNA polymerase
MDGGREIRQAAAYGVDEGSAPADEPHLGEPIRPLVERLQRQRSRAQRLRRHDIPPEHGQRRPLGIPAVADTRLPLAVRRLLTAIDEQECLRCREGYRPPMGAVDAVDTLTLTRPWGRDNGVVEAASTGVFDTIHHEGMIRLLAERLEDQALRWWIKQWLNAGGLDTDGQGLHPVTGPPQGGIRSPILAKVALHDALELGCEQGVTRRCRGEACLRSYADDCGCALEPQEDAARFDTARGQRRGTGGRERSAETTRGRACRRQPPGAQTSVECWGVACRWGTDRAGQDPLTRRPSRTQRRNALQRVTPWGKTHRHQRRGVRWARLQATLRGYDHDYGVHGHLASLTQCFCSALGLLPQGLPRRRPRRRDPWAGDTARLARCLVERPRIVGRPKTRWAASRV